MFEMTHLLIYFKFKPIIKSESQSANDCLKNKFEGILCSYSRFEKRLI